MQSEYNYTTKDDNAQTATAPGDDAQLAFEEFIEYLVLATSGQYDRPPETLTVSRDKFGPWVETASLIQTAWRTEGTEGARRAVAVIAKNQPKLSAALAGDDYVDPAELLDAGTEDEGNAQAFKIVYGEKFLYVEQFGWMFWTGTHWDDEGAEAALDRAIVDVLKRRRKAAVDAQNEAVVKAAKTSSYRLRGCKAMLTSILFATVGEFDADPDLLNVRNGALNLRTGDLTPHNPRQRFTYCVNTAYDADADKSTWVEWLSRTLDNDAEKIAYLQEAVGYSLTGHTSEEIMFYLHGPTRAGKGTFTETLNKTLGKPLSVEVAFETFSAKRGPDNQNFDLAGLKACRVVIAGESEQYTRLNTGRILTLTGGNEVTCAKKHKDPFQYYPSFKVWLASNEPLNTDPDNEAIWARVKIIRFPNSYLGREDKTLKKRLLSAANRRGVLAWAAEGARRWYSRGSAGMPTPDAVRLVTEERRIELDNVQQWMDDCTKKNEDAFTVNADVYASYSRWCENNGVNAKGKGGLTRSLKGKGFEAGIPRYVSHLAGTYRGVVGLEVVS